MSEWHIDGRDIFIQEWETLAELTVKQAEAMLNEHAMLKQAIQAAIEYFTDGKTSKEQYDAYLRFVDAAQPFFVEP